MRNSKGYGLWAMGYGLTNLTTTLHFLSPGGRGSLPFLKNLERQARRGGYLATLPFVPSHQGRGVFEYLML